MFLLLSALYNFCTGFCSKLSATSKGGTETLEFSDLCCYFPVFIIDQVIKNFRNEGKEDL